MNGKILVAGNYTKCNGTTVGNFVRLKADGSIDTTFGTGAMYCIQISEGVSQRSVKVVKY